MKYKIINYVLFSLILLWFSLPIQAQSVSTSTTPAPSDEPKPTQISAEKKLLDNQIQRLKDKIATKVAEISASNKEVISGTIESIKEGVFTISSNDKTINVTTDDEVTAYENIINPKKKLIFSDLKKNDYIVLEGVMLSGEFSAERAYLQNQYEFLTGQIKNVEKKNYFIEMVTSGQETITLDIEKYTVQKKIDPKNLTISDAGFADYKIGGRIQCVILKRKNNESRVSVERTLVVPDEIGTL